MSRKVELDPDTLQKLVTEGYTYQEIGDLFGKSRQRIGQRALEWNIFSNFGAKCIPRNAATDIAYMHLHEGFGIHSIAHSYGVSTNELTDYMHKKGIPTRGRGRFGVDGQTVSEVLTETNSTDQSELGAQLELSQGGISDALKRLGISFRGKRGPKKVSS